MTIRLTRFSIVGLHGKFDIDIPIFDNRLILVGVNGLGKTTVVSIMYFLLTSQWARLLEYEFSSIAVELNDQEIEINRSDIQFKTVLAEKIEKETARYSARSPYPVSVVRQVIGHPIFKFARDTENSGIESLARAIARELGIPISAVLRIIRDAPKQFSQDLFEHDSTSDPASISTYLLALKSGGDQKVIYLPTYRRIEQDLKAIFWNLDDDDLRKMAARTERAVGARKDGYVELIQFGMQDVEKLIADELDTIRERTRSQLSNLTASYLQDIIRNRADSINTDLISKFEEKIVELILDRVEENTLSSEDKREISLAIKRIKSGNTYQARDKYLAYFFSRLLDIYFALTSSELSIRTLVDTCNRYFERKHLEYNDTDFTAGVFDEDGSTLSWKFLSSGEKQVASLFTHLYLSKDEAQIVIIDEPELSLSVPWQKTLLPDIIKSEKCKLLVAVTHSPFVFANELESYACDLSQCIIRQSKTGTL